MWSFKRILAVVIVVGCLVFLAVFFYKFSQLVRPTLSGPVTFNGKEIDSSLQGLIQSALQDYRGNNKYGAFAKFDIAAKKYPRAFEPQYYLGIAYRELKQMDKAEEHFEKALSIRSDSYQAWDNLGGIYAYQQRFKEAEEAFQKSAKIAPNQSASHINLASLYLQTKNKTAYTEQYEILQRIDANSLRNLSRELPPPALFDRAIQQNSKKPVELIEKSQI
jgi:tetratricopeptide (TPR) repeat protein